MQRKRLTPFSQPITSEVIIPGSKSYTNRALLLAALTEGTVRIINPLFSDDTQAMMDCLNVLGINVVVEANEMYVYGSYKDVKPGTYELNAKLSGTTIRFILALACLVPGKKILTGEQGLNNRPISELVEGLRQLGAEIDYLEVEGKPPLQINSHHLNQGSVTLNGGISSQYFSALMMIAPILGGIEVNVSGHQISKPYIDMTLDIIETFGGKPKNNNYHQYSVTCPNIYSLHEYHVEGDWSGAGAFLGIAALTKSTFVLKNLDGRTKQGDIQFAEILASMGNEIIYGENEVTIVGKGVVPVSVNMESCPDQVQTLAVLAAFADGKTHITGVRSLRVKETERVKAVMTELAKMGIRTEETHDSLTIYGGNPKGSEIETYGDHRMAMSFAQAGTILDNMVINDPMVVKKTFPYFWEIVDGFC